MKNLKRKALSCAILFSLSLPIHASESNLRFEDVYNTPFWKNGWVVGGAITAVAVGAAVFTTVTAGTGAPAAAFGVSGVASTLAGGGAGSYMAGLSIVGSAVGGNAIVGAAILNGASAALIGGATLKGIATAVASSLQIAAILGISIVESGDKGKEIDFLIIIPPTKDVGSDTYKQLVKDFEENTEKMRDEDISEQFFKEKNNQIARSVLKKVSTYATQEDIVSGIVLLRNLGYHKEFKKYAKKLTCDSDSSFSCYLKSVAHLEDENFKDALRLAELAISYEEEAIEPVIIKIISLNCLEEYEKSINMEKNIENFDDDHYETIVSKATAYNVLGDFSSSNNRYTRAGDFYVKALDDLSFSDPDDLKSTLAVKAAKAYRGINDEKSEKYYKKAISYAENDDQKKMVNLIYNQ